MNSRVRIDRRAPAVPPAARLFAFAAVALGRATVPLMPSTRNVRTHSV